MISMESVCFRFDLFIVVWSVFGILDSRKLFVFDMRYYLRFVFSLTWSTEFKKHSVFTAIEVEF